MPQKTTRSRIKPNVKDRPVTSKETKQLPQKDIFLPGINFTVTTSSAAANQTLGTYQVQHKKLRIQCIIIEVYLSAPSSTPSLLGTISILNNNDVWLGPFEACNTSSGALFGIVIPLNVEIENPETISAVCTPTSTASTVWDVTVIGQEV